jgi:phosphoribosylformylglycinamidine synthase subunit PurQ / glutaminase
MSGSSVSPIGVVVFPGTNCDQDCGEAVTTIMGRPLRWLWYANPSDVTPDLAAIILPGGFSYGDYLRSGAIAALSPIMTEVRRFAEAGRPVAGICNGFQLLTEAGLLPGALTRNIGLNFLCQQRTRLVVEATDTPFTQGYTHGQVVEYPIAHGDGCYTIDLDGLQSLTDKGQVVFRYVDEVNGSVDRIAGVSNRRKNVVGLMPHPERNLLKRPQLGQTGDGVAFFTGLSQMLSGLIPA